jgi:hypothetical protein
MTAPFLTPTEAMAVLGDKHVVHTKPTPKELRLVLPNSAGTMLLPAGSTWVPKSLASHPFVTAQVELI